jgi:hypothetical protein
MSPVISADVTEELRDRVDEFREGEGDDRESRSSTVKRLVRAGIEAKEGPGGILVTYPALVTFVGWFLVAGAFVEVSDTIGFLGFGIILLGFAYSAVREYLL